MRRLCAPLPTETLVLIWLPKGFCTATLSIKKEKGKVFFESFAVAMRFTGELTVAPFAGAQIFTEGSTVLVHVPCPVMFIDDENVPAESFPTTFRTCAPDATLM